MPSSFHAARGASDKPSVATSQLPRWAGIDVGVAIIGELRPAEGAILALGLVEHGDVGLNPALVDQPGEVRGRAIGKGLMVSSDTQVSELADRVPGPVAARLDILPDEAERGLSSPSEAMDRNSYQ